MRTVSISERSKDNVLHVEAPGCIVNIRIGLFDALHDRQITVVEVIADDQMGEEWRVLDENNNPDGTYQKVRVAAYPGIRQIERTIQAKLATEASHMTPTGSVDKPVESYPITSLSRADIDDLGYDSSKLDNETFEYMAQKMGDGFVEYGGYWDDLRELCNRAKLPYDPTKDNMSDDYEDEDA